MPMDLRTRTLIDTRVTFDARSLGYDGACDPMSDGLGLVLSYQWSEGVGPCFKMIGPEGEIELTGAAEAAAVANAILERLAFAAREAA